jgi:hypothetical protein
MRKCMENSISNTALTETKYPVEWPVIPDYLDYGLNRFLDTFKCPVFFVQNALIIYIFKVFRYEG